MGAVPQRCLGRFGGAELGWMMGHSKSGAHRDTEGWGMLSQEACGVFGGARVGRQA